jgi:hypothetical protein
VTVKVPARLGSPLLALGAALVLALVLAYVSTSVSRPPVIVTWQAQPAHVARGGSAVLRVAAADPDGGRLQYAYAAERGRIAADVNDPTTARYTAPLKGETDAVTVTVTDARGLTATASTPLTIDAIDAPPAPVEVASPLEPTPLVPAAAPGPRSPLPAIAPTQPPPTPLRVVERREPTPVPPTPSGPNHAPVLEKGTTIEGIGTGSVVLVANGYDPDGDSLEYEWDTKGCFDVLRQNLESAEVKFGYCTWGVVRLTWKDPGGLTATAEWTISK